MGFEDTRTEGNHNIQYTSAIADDIVRDCVFGEHRAPTCVKSHCLINGLQEVPETQSAYSAEDDETDNCQRIG